MKHISFVAVCCLSVAGCDVMSTPQIGGLEEECSTEATCRDDLVCDMRTYTCSKWGGLNEPCSSSGRCSGDYVCDSEADYDQEICVVWGNEGSPCSGAGRCRGELLCDKETYRCVEWGNFGEPCSASGKCRDGLKCNDSWNECVRCIDYSDCGDDQGCYQGSCRTKCTPFCEREYFPTYHGCDSAGNHYETECISIDCNSGYHHRCSYGGCYCSRN